MKCIVNILIVSLLRFESVDKIGLKKYINSFFLFPSNQLELK